MPAPPIDFANCIWGVYPYLVGKPSIHPYNINSYVGYAKSVLRCKTGHPLAQDNVFDGAMYNAVRDMQTMFGVYPVDGHITANDWPVIDYLATH